MKKINVKRLWFLQAVKFLAINISILLIIGTVFLGCQEKDDSQQGISIDQTDELIITKASEGYTTAPSKSVNITNIENTVIEVTIDLSGTNLGSFIINPSSLTIKGKESETFTVSPKIGLVKGIYTATVTISAKGIKSKKIDVSFTVDTAQDLYIAFGQSNMQGPGEIRASDKQGINNRRWRILNVVTDTYASTKREKGKWYPAVPPLIIPDSGLSNYLGLSIGLGPSDHFIRTMVDGTTDHMIGIVAVANGDLALSSFRKTGGAAYFSAGDGGTVTLNGVSVNRTSGRPSSTERQGWTRYTGAGYSSFYDAIVTNVKLAQNDGWNLKGIIFHQGESGRGLEDKSWVEILKEIYDDILTDCGLASNSIPILCGQPFGGGQVDTSTGNDGGDNLGYMLHTDNRIQGTIPNAWVISSDGCGARTGNQQPDGVHFGSAGLQLLGERYGQKMLDLVK